MRIDNVEYVMEKLRAIRKLAQLGARSEHHMEREIFREINDNMAAPYDCLSAELELQEKANG